MLIGQCFVEIAAHADLVRGKTPRRINSAVDQPRIPALRSPYGGLTTLQRAARSLNRGEVRAPMLCVAIVVPRGTRNAKFLHFRDQRRSLQSQLAGGTIRS